MIDFYVHIPHLQMREAFIAYAQEHGFHTGGVISFSRSKLCPLPYIIGNIRTRSLVTHKRRPSNIPLLSIDAAMEKISNASVICKINGFDVIRTPDGVKVGYFEVSKDDIAFIANAVLKSQEYMYLNPDEIIQTGDEVTCDLLGHSGWTAAIASRGSKPSAFPDKIFCRKIN
jgi:hypothetical protein